MEDRKISQELEEDEELASLRLAALATLKSRVSQSTESVSNAENILPISSISRNVTHSSDHGSRNNQHSWRNNAQLSKRKGKSFPKSSQRSNLIVITPIGVEKKKASPELKPVPQLLLPQHKWCQQVHEDSSSPRTERHTGPSRFNRHGSESESSDSEYEDSDDSYSNETVLQDEPSRLSPVENSNDAIDSECKHSFKYLDTDLNSDIVNRKENNGVYNCIRTSFPCSHSEDTNPNKNEIEANYCVSQSNTLNIYDYKDKLFSNTKTSSENSKNILSTSASLSKQKSKHTPIKFDVPKSLEDESKTNSDIDPGEKKYVESSVFAKKSKSFNFEENATEEPKMSVLSKNDLRFELKRKKATMITFPSVSSKLLNTDQIRYDKNKGRKIYPRQSRDSSKRQDHGKYALSHNRDRSKTPEIKGKHFNKGSFSSSRSRSSSFSSSSSSSVSSSDSSPKINRSISSVVKPVSSLINADVYDAVPTSNNKNSFQLSFTKNELPPKKAKSIEIKLMPVSNFKISVSGNDSRNIAPDSKKRGPVHMRLGALPQKRIIQMPKDVEAAFVSTSSDDEDVNNKCKKPNCMVLTDFCDKKTDGFVNRSKKKSLLRSDVPKSGKGKVFR